MNKQITELPGFDFLTLRIQQILDNVGFENISEKTRKEFLPSLSLEAEKRVNFAIMSRLNEAALQELDKLLENKNLQPEELGRFWSKYIPDANELLAKVLNDFEAEVKQILAQIRHK